MNDKGYHLKGDLIATRKQTRCNLFQLNANVNICLVARTEEGWLWHKRFCHLNFDNLIRVNKSSMVRAMPQILKPDMCYVKNVRWVR